MSQTMPKNTFKIATWNVNSLRVRLPHVIAWIREKKPDVLALQEIKMTDEDFPHDAFHDIGYDAISSGQRTYNGVATLLNKNSSIDHTHEIIRDFPLFEDAQRRVLCLTIGDIRIINVYVPNGQAVTSPKYQYKLTWLNHLMSFIKQELFKHSRLVVLGDFNIAPQELDVHDPSLWNGQVLFSEAERNAFQSLLRLGLSDCFRLLHPNEQAFSWWDYRMGAFRRNMGLRIDHILVSNDLASSCIQCEIDKVPRTLERPSDHAPVLASFQL